MTRGVITVSPQTSLREVARTLSDSRISGVPVVDETGACIGIVSEGDLLAKQAGKPMSRRPLDWIFGERRDPDDARRRAATTAVEAMSSPAITIEVDRPLRGAAALMVDRGVNRLPVVAEGKLVGIVSRADLVRAYLRLDDEILAAVRDDVLRRTMWLDPSDFDVSVRDGAVRVTGQVDRRSTARIIERLIGLVDGVMHVESGIGWDSDDSHLEPTAETESEPGAASLTSRERPQPLHR
jgi:CBS domain-containing protein